MNDREINQTRRLMCAEHGKTCTWSVFAHIGWAEQKMKEWRAKHEESVGA